MRTNVSPALTIVVLLVFAALGTCQNALLKGDASEVEPASKC